MHYSLTEIDKMRKLVFRKRSLEESRSETEFSYSYIEDMLKTYILAGVTARELSDEVDWLSSQCNNVTSKT